MKRMWRYGSKRTVGYRQILSLVLFMFLVSETQPVAGQQQKSGVLVRAGKAGEGQVLSITADSTGRYALLQMAEPNQLCVYSLQQDANFDCIARSNVSIGPACFSPDGNTILLGGFGLRTWSFRDGTGYAIDMDRNPKSRQSSYVSVNSKSGQIVANDWNVTYSSDRGLYIASDISGCDGVWTEIPGRHVRFTENGHYLMVLSKTHFAIYEPKGTELGPPRVVFRELNPATLQITSEVSVLTQEGESTATRQVVRGQAYKFSTCTVGETHYLAFATSSPTDEDCSTEIWAFSDSRHTLAPRCAIVPSTGNICSLRLNGQLVPCLVSIDADGVNLLWVSCVDGQWQAGRSIGIDCSTLPLELSSEEPVVSSFEVSAGKNSIFVGYSCGCFAEWQIPDVHE